MPCLPRPSNRQRSSVCMCLYLSRGTGACAGSGVHAARRQPCFWWAVVHFVILCVGEWLVAPCVPHPRLPPPSYRQRSSVYIYMYLSRWNGVCADTGAHAARRQPCFWCAVVHFVFCVWDSGLWHRVCPIPASPRPHIASAAACIFICICRGGVGRVRAQGRMLHVGNHVFGGQLCILFILLGEWLVAPCATHARLLPPPC